MPTGQVFEVAGSAHHDAAGRGQQERRAERPNSSAPSSAARTTSRPVFRPPSTWSRTRPAKPAAGRASRCVSARPISHGRPDVLDRGQRRGAGPAVRPRRRGRCRRGPSTTPARSLPTPISDTSLTETSRVGVGPPQIKDELRQVLDRIDVVMRRRARSADARRACGGSPRSRRHLVPGELPAFARLRALRHLDLELVGEREYSGVTPKRPEATCLIASPRVAVRACVKRPASSPPSPVFDLPPMTVHRDGERLVRLARDRADATSRRSRTGAGSPSPLHLLERHDPACRPESRRSRGSLGRRPSTSSAYPACSSAPSSRSSSSRTAVERRCRSPGSTL